MNDLIDDDGEVDDEEEECGENIWLPNGKVWNYLVNEYSYHNNCNLLPYMLYLTKYAITDHIQYVVHY